MSNTISLWNKFCNEYKQDLFALDVETTMAGPDNRPDAYYWENGILAIGYSKIVRDNQPPIVHIDELRFENLNTKLFVGHNIKFDRSHLRGSYIRRGLPAPHVNVFLDVGIATYLHSGHRITSPTLDQVAEYWGVPDRKLDTLKNTLTQDIPQDELNKYLENDVRMTVLIARAILKSVPKGKLYLYWLYSKASMLVGEMEFNGLPVDFQALRSEESRLIARQEFLVAKMANAYLTFSPYNYSTAVFKLHPSGAVNYVRQTVLLTGSRLLEHVAYADRPHEYKIPAKYKAYGNGEYKWEHRFAVGATYTIGESKVDAEALEECIKQLKYSLLTSTTSARYDFLISYQEYVKNRKLLTTYITNFIAACETSSSTRVRSKYNTCVTATSRLSSSSPNAQNLPQAVRAYVTPPVDDVIVSGDFKQIEICTLAYETQDNHLLYDLNNGIDIHARAGKGWIPNRELTEEERRNVKGVVFGTIYGGMPRGLSKQTGLSEAVVNTIQKQLYRLYPIAFTKQDKRRDSVRYTANMSTELFYDSSKRAYKYGTWSTLSGHVYSFRQYYSEYKPHLAPDVSATEIKDRPIQGTAAEWKMMFLALLEDVLYSSELPVARAYRSQAILPIADVHDEIVFQCPANLADDLAAMLQTLASVYLPDIIKEVEVPTRPDVPPIIMNTKINTTWTK